MRHLPTRGSFSLSGDGTGFRWYFVAVMPGADSIVMLHLVLDPDRLYGQCAFIRISTSFMWYSRDTTY